MKNFIPTHFYKITSLLAIATAFIITSCADHPSTHTRTSAAPSKFGYGGTNVDTAFVTNDSSTNTAATNTPSTATTPSANPFLSPTPRPVATTRDIPYGTPVPGKPGYVISPFSPNAGYVDVHGFPPGTEVKDPYSQKIFLVP